MRYSRTFRRVAVLGALACNFETADDYPPERVLRLDVCALDAADCAEPAISANGVDRARIVVEFPEDSATGGKLVLTTTLGTLDPGAMGAGQTSRDLMVPATGSLSAVLQAGTDSGEAIVRATLGTVTVERVVPIEPAAPTALDLIGSPYVLTATQLSSNLSVYLYNESGAKTSVSTGIDVHLHACSAGGKRAEVPRLVRTEGPKTGLVAATLTLNALGTGLVNEVGPDTPDEELYVHAYVIGADEEAPQLAEGSSCADVQAALADTSIQAEARFLLRRKPM